MKNANPKVSVIMPSLNVGKYIRESLTSVCNQTLKEIEIICVDAGSTDGTLEIIKEFAASDKRIKVIHSDKKSYGYQMNVGIHEAQGDYIGIVETDDAVLGDMYERMFNVAYSNDVDVLKADYIRFEGDLNSPYYSRSVISCSSNSNLYGRIINPAKDLRAIQFSIICGNLYSRSFLLENNISFNETLGASYQDIGFYIQTSVLARKVYFLKEAFYLYRRDNPNSSINNKSKVFAVCSEFDFIRQKLFSSMSIKRRFGKIFGKELFFAYWSTLVRIGEQYREEFIKRFSQDLKAAYLQGEIDSKNFSPRNWMRILRIMTMPIAFLDEEFGVHAPCSEHLVVSLTTWPKRIATVHKVIDNMLLQSRRPDKVILYLAEDEFPNRKLPEPLELRLKRDERFEVRFVDNLYSHKKYLHVFKDFPGSVIVLVDDDIVYPNTMLRELMVHYRRNPHAVVCFRSHTMVMAKNRQFAPYCEWMKERKIINRVSHLIFPTTGGGTLFPPNVLPPETFDVQKIRTTALTADDLWIKWHLMLNGVPVKYINGYGSDKLLLIPGTQAETLCSINVTEKKNDKIWKKILSLYPVQAELLKTLLYEWYIVQFPIRQIPALSWPIRKLRGLRMCLCENGLRYTFFHLFEKIFGKLNQICRQLTRSSEYWAEEKKIREKNKTRVKAVAKDSRGGLSNKGGVERFSSGVNVSVIIPVYNGGSYIKECLDSILCQSLKEIEVVAVDDGSTDDSLKILKDYSENDVRVKWFSQKNSGASIARNRGINLSSGEFVCFVDPDDMLADPRSLEILYGAAKKHGVLASCGSLERFDPSHPENGTSRPPHWQFPVAEVRDWTLNPFEFCYQLFIFNRRMLINEGIYFPNVARYQDPPFMVRAMMAARHYHVSPVIAYRYRLGHQNINWSRDDYKKLRDMFVAMRDVICFATKNKLPKLVEATVTRLTTDYRDVVLSVSCVRDFPEWKNLVASVPVHLQGLLTF